MFWLKKPVAGLNSLACARNTEGHGFIGFEVSSSAASTVFRRPLDCESARVAVAARRVRRAGLLGPANRSPPRRGASGRRDTTSGAAEESRRRVAAIAAATVTGHSYTSAATATSRSALCDGARETTSRHRMPDSCVVILARGPCYSSPLAPPDSSGGFPKGSPEAMR